MTGKNILVALDHNTLAEAAPITEKLRGKTGFKVGSVMNTYEGLPAIIDKIGTHFFLDLKYHDIPNTVAGAVAAAARREVTMLNMHCSGSKKMMRSARDAADAVMAKTGKPRPLLIGVTILTSLDQESVAEVGMDPNLPIKDLVVRLAALAYESGLDGVVCSPHEITAVRRAICDDGFQIITPGIRKKNSPPDDQRRTMTIREARDLGADYFVIGRPIIDDPDPVAAAEEFIYEIAA